MKANFKLWVGAKSLRVCLLIVQEVRFETILYQEALLRPL